MDWLTGITTANFYNWGLVLYTICAAATICYVAWLGYRVGLTKGLERGREEASAKQPPSRFRQRTAEADPSRFAVIRRARLIARRQRTPQPRRGNPGKP